MCGIAGYLTQSTAPAPGVLESMVARLHHRGPDGAGFYHDGGYHAGMRRLAIVDLLGGDQPLYNADRSVVLVYNGEIYNYPELRKRLESKGYHFRTNSDGEVICHLYSEHGEDLFGHLDGMFAAALWDTRARRLILARDIPGEKPLYYSEPRPGEVVFASELSAMRAFPGLDLALDHQAIWDFPTFLWIPEPRTVHRHIKALPPRHLLVVEQGNSRLRSYENCFNIAGLLRQNEADVVVETRRVVEEAVKSRLLSDVPIGSFLSGGLDSSIVATLAARELDSLDTFSIGFEDLSDPYHGKADESAAAAETARRIGSRHHAIKATSASFRDSLETFCAHGDQPFAVSSGLGILAVAKAARDANIKVLLSGDGADESFGGYSWYAHFEAAERAQPAASDHILSFQNFGEPLDKRLAAIAAMPAAEQAWAWHYYAHEEEKSAIFSREFAEAVQSSLRHLRPPSGERWKPIDLVAHDRAFYFPFEMLRKVDRMTMAHSVEGRVPFAAPSVLSHASKLTFGHMIAPNGTLKHVLRKAFADILPPEVVERPKHGFNVPIDHWLKGDWSDLVEETFSAGSALSRSGMLAPGARGTALRLLNDARRLNGHSIFCFIMLNWWLENETRRNHR